MRGTKRNEPHLISALAQSRYMTYCQYRQSTLTDYGSHDARVRWASEERRTRLLVYSISQGQQCKYLYMRDRGRRTRLLCQETVQDNIGRSKSVMPLVGSVLNGPARPADKHAGAGLDHNIYGRGLA